MTSIVALGNLLADKGYIRGPFGSALRRSEMKQTGIPVYEQQNAIYDHRNFRFYIDDKKYQELKRFTVKPGDLVISCSGTLGKITVIRENDPLGIISQALLILRPDTSKISSDYLYYFLTSPVGQYLLLGASHGSVQTNIAKKEVVSAIKIPLPSEDEQAKIVGILSTIDEKIELNRRMNETLEQMGQTLFEHYFITNPEVKQWKIKPISELIDVYSGYAFKRADFDPDGLYGLVTIKNVQDASFIATCTDRLSELPSKVPAYVHLKSGDILLSLTGNVGRVCLAYGDNLLLNQRVAKIVGKNCGQPFAYFLFRQNTFKDKLVSMSRGTAQLNLSPIETKNIGIPCPPCSILESFHTLANPLLTQIVANFEEIQTLANLRNALLPRLISGKVSHDL